MACLAVQGLMYIGQNIMTSKEFVEHCFEGAKSMLTMAIIVLFAMTLSAANKELGFFEIVIGGAGRAVPPVLLPATAFVIVAAATFATAGYWVIQVLSIPIFIPLALSLNVNPALVIAAIMSGVTFGCSFCFYADPVFMTAAATGISNLRIIKLSSPYALSCAALAVIGYVIAGILMV
jgi:Na+/H+ antiporter NhaC